MILLILAAGLGSRYGGEKQVDALGPQGEWIMDLNLHDAAAAGFPRAVIVCRAGMTETIAAHLARFAPPRMHIDYAIQDAADLPRVMPSRDKPWGTGHALLAARSLLDEPFLVANADDCYGPGCFAVAAPFLAARCSTARGALVAYELQRTLSPHGSLSRGICRGQDGLLQQVIEHHGIAIENGVLAGAGPQGRVALAANCPVSLNSWCLHPAVCARLWQQFDEWLATGPVESDEFQLPTALDAQLQRDALAIELLSCREPWLGMTYREDRTAVAEHLLARFQSGSLRQACSRVTTQAQELSPLSLAEAQRVMIREICRQRGFL